MINLAFFTSTRGDISIINPLLKEIQRDKRFKYKLYVHGTHLEKKFGYTINEIKNLNLASLLQKAGIVGIFRQRMI